MVTVVVGGAVVAEETVVGGPVGACVKLKEGGAGLDSAGLMVIFGGPRRKRLFFSIVQCFTASTSSVRTALGPPVRCHVGTLLCPHNHAVY